MEQERSTLVAAPLPSCRVCPRRCTLRIFRHTTKAAFSCVFRTRYTLPYCRRRRFVVVVAVQPRVESFSRTHAVRHRPETSATRLQNHTVNNDFLCTPHVPNTSNQFRTTKKQNQQSNNQSDCPLEKRSPSYKRVQVVFRHPPAPSNPRGPATIVRSMP